MQAHIKMDDDLYNIIMWMFVCIYGYTIIIIIIIIIINIINIIIELIIWSTIQYFKVYNLLYNTERIWYDISVNMRV